jgi:probable rRNA maturation factor
LVGIDHGKESSQEKANGKEDFSLRFRIKTAVFHAMSRPTLTLDFQISASAWKRIPGLRARLQRAARATMARLPATLRFSARATVLLASDAKVRQLNFDFRGIDKTTNVLSFPQFLPQEIRRLKKQKEPVELGDIALAYQRTTGEAKNDGKRPADHATHLVIHGLLHLLGYDHVGAREARKMEKTETEILKSLGHPDPYAPLNKKNKNRRLSKN